MEDFEIQDPKTPHHNVGQSVEAAFSTLSGIFSALSAYFNNFQLKVPSCDIKEPYLIVSHQNNVEVC